MDNQARLKELEVKELLTLEESLELIMLMSDVGLDDAIEILDQYIEDEGFERLN